MHFIFINKRLFCFLVKTDMLNIVNQQGTELHFSKKDRIPAILAKLWNTWLKRQYVAWDPLSWYTKLFVNPTQDFMNGHTRLWFIEQKVNIVNYGVFQVLC